MECDDFSLLRYCLISKIVNGSLAHGVRTKQCFVINSVPEKDGRKHANLNSQRHLFLLSRALMGDSLYGTFQFKEKYLNKAARV